MTLRLVLLGGWLVLVAAPLGWWWWRVRGRVDVFTNLPVPAALLDGQGRVAEAHPGWPGWQVYPEDVPAPGARVKTRAGDGTPLALVGLRGGALAVAVEAEPGLAHRHRQLLTLVPLLQHEVRGGLQGLLGQLALLEAETASQPARASLAAARREANRMIEVVDGAELLVRIGRTPPPRTVIPVASLLGEALADRPELATDLPDLGVLVEACDWQLIRVIRNLVDNAERHGRPPVRLEVTVTGDAVTVAVLDAGPGLRPAELPRLCAPFARGATGAPGSGLGLAVAAEVLAGHGSALAALAGGVGFTLPRFRS